MTSPHSSKIQNRLAHEKSPYLLQHAANPVDWFPWGAEAFAKAKSENKLIFLSIGYSTCHWCHVMERESFENTEVAALLNKDFVSIKVDREERPDIDHIYMGAVQAMTGSGGWPLSVFLTPEGDPITGGTYFPPEDRWGRPGMKTVLPRMVQLWTDQKSEAERAGKDLSRALQGKSETGTQNLSESLLHDLFNQFASGFDPDHGGFGGAPKFPRTHDLSFLLAYFFRTQNKDALHMVETTLDFMARGGIYDHLGGGFARYSTDKAWLVPHFEKMLYDQALLVKTYAEAYQLTQNAFYREVAEDVLRYVARDMTHAQGGFFSAEDADSEGEEGKFYVWRPEEIVALLGPQLGKLFNDFYGVTDGGNFEHATSILSVATPVYAFAEKHRIPPAELTKVLAGAREKLFEVRKKRIPPYKDDKILTAWNGLMISAFAFAGFVFNHDAYVAQAERAAEFILTHNQKNGRLLRRFREGESAIPAFQDDFAFFIAGLLDLYHASEKNKWLEEALRLAKEMDRLFWDEAGGGYFYTASDSEALIARTKEYYDGATPSGNSAAAFALLRLAKLTEDPQWEKRAEKVFQSNAASASKYPMAYPHLFAAFDFAIGPSREVVLTGDEKSAEFQRMKNILRRHYDPHLSLSFRVGEKNSASICQNQTCQPPVFSAEELEKMLVR